MTFFYIENKQHNIYHNSLVSHSLFFGLTNGVFVTNASLTLSVSFCIFDHIIKEGKGACIETNSPSYLKVLKCSASRCGVYSNQANDPANSHVIYLDSNLDKKSFLLESASIFACASDTLGVQWSIVRSSRTDSDVFDLNISHSYTTAHSIAFRTFNETKLKRIILSTMSTHRDFLYYEYGTNIFVDKMIVSHVRIINNVTFVAWHNTIIFTDSSFDFQSSIIDVYYSSVTFDKCFFVDKTPSLSDGVTIINNITSIDFGESIINVGEIYEEINKVIKGLITRRHKFVQLLINIFLYYLGRFSINVGEH